MPADTQCLFRHKYSEFRHKYSTLSLFNVRVINCLQLSFTNLVREELQAALGVGQRLPTEQGEPRALERLRGHDEPRAHAQPRDAALERRAQLRREARGRAEDLGEM